MDEQTSSTLIERLDRLERGLWWWKVTGSVAIAMLALILLLGATQATVPEEIRAKRFVVVEGNGKTQMVLGDSRLDFYWEGQWRGSLEPARWEGEKGELKPGGLLITPRLQVAMFPEMTTRPQVVLDWN